MTLMLTTTKFQVALEHLNQGLRWASFYFFLLVGTFSPPKQVMIYCSRRNFRVKISYSRVLELSYAIIQVFVLQG